MRQLVIDHDLPFAADEILIVIGLAVVAVVLGVLLVALVWPLSRRWQRQVHRPANFPRVPAMPTCPPTQRLRNIHAAHDRWRRDR
jgi:Na+-transporting methylmalonyl-CoA/oxaloacetate decarboxylase gamma subunit